MSSTPPEAQPKTPPRTRAWLIAPIMFLLLVALGAHWKWTRARAHREARALLTDVFAFRHCVDRARGEMPNLSDAMSFAVTEERPLSPCSRSLADALASGRRLSELRPLMDRAALDETLSALGDLTRAGLDGTAGELAASGPEQIEDKVERLAQSVCRVAISEDASDYKGCAMPYQRLPPLAPPAPRSILHEKTSWLEHVSLAIDARGDRRFNVLVGSRERESLRSVARVASTLDAGERWTVATLECEEASLGDPDAPELTFDSASGAPRLFFMALRDYKGAFTGGTIGRVAEDLRSIQFLADVPGLPPGLEPVRTGSPVVELEGGAVGVLLSPKQDGPGGGVMVLEDEKHRFTPLASGRLAAGQAGPPARIVATDSASDGSTRVAVLGVPTAGGSFPEPTFNPLGSKTMSAQPGRERWCGAPGRASFPLLWRDSTQSHLGSLGSGAMSLAAIATPRGGDLDVTCGRCAPLLFWRSETDLAFVVPGSGGRRQVSVGTPVLYSAAKSWRSAISACTADRVAVAYLQNGSVYVQTADRRGLSFSRPRLVAAPNADGSPREIAIAGNGRRLLVVWRRAAERPYELRVEMLASDDGGSSWH